MIHYLPLASAVVGVVTHSPILRAVPSLVSIFTNCYPKLFPLGVTKSFTATAEEKAKLEKVKSLLPNICKDLGLEDSVINLRISTQLGANACMIGTTSSWGGPLLCLGDTYFKNYEPVQSEGSGKIAEAINKDPEFDEWITLLNEIPDAPSALGKYLDECSRERQERIKILAQKFKNILSQNELESILAHELGHAKHHHLLKYPGIILIVFTADKLVQLFANVIGFGVLYAIVSIPLSYLTIRFFSRHFESEADRECAIKDKYRKGLIEFHKKDLIVRLFAKKSSSLKDSATKMLHAWGWTSTHPNSAKRLQQMLQLAEQQEHSPTKMTIAGWALTGIGVISIAENFFSRCTDIWNSLS